MRKVLTCLATLFVIALCAGSTIALGQEQGKQQVPPPAAPLVIQSAETEGRVGEDLAHLTMKLRAECYEDGRHAVPLFPAGVAVTDWSVKGEFFGPKAYIRPDTNVIELVAEGKGSFTVTLEFVLPVEKERLGRRINLPIVPALVSKSELSLPGAELDVKVSEGASLETLSARDSTTVRVYGGRDGVALTWTPKAPEKVLKPIIFADQTIRLRVGQGVTRVDSTIDYSIVQGSMKDIEVRLPADLSLLNVDGKEIRSWDVLDVPEGRLLKVSLLGEVEKDYRLELRLEKVLPEVETVIEAPQIEPLNVVRERGQIVVAAAKGISVEAVELKEISHVDVREMPAALQMTGEEVRLGFRYLKRPFTLKLRTGEVVAKTSAEVMTLVRAGMDSLRLTAVLNYTIRDAGVFQFRVALDPALKLIDVNGANINNWQFDEATRVLTVALRSKAEGKYSLEIEAEQEKPNPERTVVPPVHALDVDRETGYVAILPAPGMKVETAAVSGISQVDVKELPDFLLRSSPALAYRYIRPAYQVAVRISEIEPEVTADIRTIATLDDQELAMDTEIHYDIRRAGVFQIRVEIPKELRRRNIEGADIDDTSWDEESDILTVNLRSRVMDKYVLRIQTDKMLESIDQGVLIPTIRALDVKKERGFVAMVTKASVRIKADDEGTSGLDDISLGDLPPEMLRKAGNIAMAFKYFAPPWSLALSVERIEPRVTAEVFNLLSIGEKLMSVSATVQYTIQHAGTDTFIVKLPIDATAVDINGEGIKHRDQDKQTNSWTITLQSKRENSYALYISFQHKLSEEQTTIPYSGIEAVGVERETGYLAVTSRPDVELKVGAQDIQNATAIDAREIPASYMEGVALPVLLAFRYVSHPYSLNIAALPHNAAEVTTAVVESVRFSTTVTEEGNMITDMVCMLRNSRQQYLDLRLPAGSRIWHAFVGQETVSPLTDGEVTKIPVARLGDDTNAPFEVRIRYSDERPKLGRVGSIKLESPIRDIDIMRLGWTLVLPESYDVVHATGNIRRLDSLRYMEGVLLNLNPDAQVSVAVRRGGVAQKKMGYQELANVNAAQMIQSGPMSNAINPSIYTGSKPIEGRLFTFQALIVTAEEPAWLEAQYVKSSIGIPVSAVIILVGIIIAAIFWKLFGKHPRLIRVVVLVLVALVVCGIRTLSEGAYRSYFTTLIATLFAVAGVMLVHTIVVGIRTLVRRQKEKKAGRIAELIRKTETAQPAAPAPKTEERWPEDQPKEE
jgi:hypothetical protein